MNDPVLMQVLERIDDLNCETLHFKFMQSLSSSQEFIQGLVCAQLQQDVNVLSILKEVLELDNVIVLY